MKSVINVLGLNKCRDTIVGNNTMRGISGGEKRRVTLGEMLMSPTKCKLCDSITTGLDSATAVDIVRTLRGACKALHVTVVMALLQAYVCAGASSLHLLILSITAYA